MANAAAVDRLKARQVGRGTKSAYNTLEAIAPALSVESSNDIVMISGDLLDDFSGHTFSHGGTLSDYEQAILDSIKANGILQPLFVRSSKTTPGRYEIIAGHTRRRLGIMAGLSEFPCIVRDVDDDVATIFMIESNLQRPDWQPSEKAASYKAHLEATARILNKQAGRPPKDWPAFKPDKIPGRVRDVAAQRFGITGKMFDIYIKLNDLSPELLSMVDESRITVKGGYNLSFLSFNQQSVISSWLDRYPHIKIDERKASDLRACDQLRWPEILGIRKAKKTDEPQVRITLPFKQLKIPKDEFSKPEFVGWLVEVINSSYETYKGGGAMG